MSVFIDEELLILRRTRNWRFQALVLDGTMLAILDRLDGARPLGKIFRELGIDQKSRETAIFKLMEYDLVEVKNLQQVLSKPFGQGASRPCAVQEMTL